MGTGKIDKKDQAFNLGLNLEVGLCAYLTLYSVSNLLHNIGLSKSFFGLT